MTTRQQRRRAAREAAKDPRNGKSEVFTYTDENDEEQWLDVEPLRRWAEKNLTPVMMGIDVQMVERIIQSGRVTQDHVVNHTFKQGPRPILVAEEFHDGGAEIVDGNHTYVAMAITAAKARGMGLMIPPGIPAYRLERKHWTRFLVPPEARG